MGALPCIGPEKPDMYDVSYSIMDDHMDWTVSCLGASETHRNLDPARLIQSFEGALLDMRALVEQTQNITDK